jgi:hypothetical protein
MEFNTTGSNNTAVGRNALVANTTASNNTAIGSYALIANTTGAGNTAVGNDCMDSNTTGENNVAMGVDALQSNTTGNRNVAIGQDAGYSVTTGSNNTFVGRAAGNNTVNHTTGHDCTFIGAYAHGDSGGASHQISIGYNVNSAGNNTVTIGRDHGSGSRIYNTFSSNATWTHSSDQRFKKEITTNTDAGLDFINDLRTVTYKWKAPSELDSSMHNYDADKTTVDYDKKMYGLIAQEVKTAMDSNSITDFAGWNKLVDGMDDIQGISNEMFVIPLIKAVQELSAKVKALEDA